MNKQLGVSKNNRSENLRKYIQVFLASKCAATLEDYPLKNIHFSIIFSQGGQMHGCNNTFWIRRTTCNGSVLIIKHRKKPYWSNTNLNLNMVVTALGDV